MDQTLKEEIQEEIENKEFDIEEIERQIESLETDLTFTKSALELYKEKLAQLNEEEE